MDKKLSQLVFVSYSLQDVQHNYLLIIINCGLSIFVFLYEEPSNHLYSHIRGANSMLTSLMIVLSGEFPEAVFQIVCIQLTKLIYVILISTEKEYEVLSGNVLIMVLLIYYLYYHHKAIRCQYLLTLVDQKWENVLENIIENQSYFIMTFDQETYKFNLQSQCNCQTYFLDYKLFLRESHIEKQNLEDYLFFQIRNYSNNHISKSQIIFIKNELQLLKLKYSIYYTTQPTILIIFETVQQSQNYNNFNLLYKKIHIYNRMLLQLNDQLQNERQFSFRLKNHLQVEHVMYQIEQGMYMLKTIKLNKFLLKFKQISILNSNQITQGFKICTLPRILTALFSIIQDYSSYNNNEKKNRNQILLSYSNLTQSLVEIIIQGKFQVEQIQNLMDMYKLQFYMILYQFDIYQDQSIKLILKRKVQIPFIEKIVK